MHRKIYANIFKPSNPFPLIRSNKDSLKAAQELLKSFGIEGPKKDSFDESNYLPLERLAKRKMQNQRARNNFNLQSDRKAYDNKS